jgi:hypothetical protein
MRRFGFTTTLALALSLTAGGALAAPVPTPAEPRDATAVSAADVRASNAKIRDAYAHLAAMWEDAFDEIGERFAPPSLVRYRGGAPTDCGVMRSGNAGYCVRDNTIYYDELFVAAQAKRAAIDLGTDGDMAAIGVIAHEVGHAVAMQLGHLSRYTYENERLADCLGGAFARRAADEGFLEAGDVDEAFYGMAAAADPTPRLTGDRRVDRAILVRAAVMGHGTREQRTANFRRGLEGGAGGCLAEFR